MRLIDCITSGLMKYNQQVRKVEYCDGSKWLSLPQIDSSIRIGYSPLQPASTCKEIALKYKSSLMNGQYWIKPSSTHPPFQVKNY